MPVQYSIEGVQKFVEETKKILELSPQYPQEYFAKMEVNKSIVEAVQILSQVEFAEQRLYEKESYV